MSDRVTLTVPARGEFAKTVRMTAAQLASRMDMSFDDVEDVRLAAEEVFIYASETFGEGEDLSLHFDLGEDTLSIHVLLGDCLGREDDEGRRRDSYARFILESICDTFELVTREEPRYLRVVKAKQPEIADAG